MGHLWIVHIFSYIANDIIDVGMSIRYVDKASNQGLIELGVKFLDVHILA
jgi:hypothetical protein